MVSYPACQGALQSRHCVSNRWTCKNSTADTECVLSHSVTVPLHSHLTLFFLHLSSDSVPLLVPPSSSLPHPITEQHSGTLTPPRPTIDNVVHMLMKEPISENDFFFFSPNRKTLTGYLKSCGNRHTQSPMIWLKCSLSNCLCGCCVDKTQTNYSVGRWLSAQQQSVGVMDRRCSQMGFLGRGNQRCCPLNPGLYLLLVKAPKKIAVLAS